MSGRKPGAKVVNLAAERRRKIQVAFGKIAAEAHARQAAAAPLEGIRTALRAMPIDLRAETIVGIFRIISAEFAAMVLEHVQPPPPPRRRKR